MAIKIPNSDHEVSPPEKVEDTEALFTQEPSSASQEGEAQSSPEAKQGEARDPLKFADDLLKKAGADKPQEKKEEKGREREDYYKGVVIRPEDVGLTLYNVIDAAEKGMDPITELSEEESRMLDDMLTKGYTTFDISLRKGFPVGFRTVNSVGVQRGYDILAPISGSRDKMSSLFTDMVVATHLNYYGNENSKIQISHRAKAPEEFTSEEALRERFEFVRDKLDTGVVNALLRRVRDFIEVTNRAARAENIVNF